MTRPHYRHEEESAGRERWLSADELRGLLGAIPAAWRPFFALLAYTGLRLGEVIGKRGAAALRWSDVRLSERRLTVQNRTRRLKTSSSARDVPLPDVLIEMLAAHRVTTPGGPADAVFPYPFTYGQAQRYSPAAASRPTYTMCASMISAIRSPFTRFSQGFPCPACRSSSVMPPLL